jgi:hypothetical protein
MQMELVDRELRFHLITGFAARPRILKKIPSLVIDAVNPVIDIAAVSVPALDLLAGRLSAEIARAFSDREKFVKRQLEFKASSFGLAAITRKQARG